MNFFTVEFSPAPSLSGQLITATVSSTSGASCLPAATSVVQDAQTITLRLDYEDFCQSGNPLVSRDYAIGSYPAGVYAFQIKWCADNPPPLPSQCSIAFQGVLSVGSQTGATVPATSLSGDILMVAVIAVMALVRLHARRYYEYRMAA